MLGIRFYDFPCSEEEIGTGGWRVEGQGQEFSGDYTHFIVFFRKILLDWGSSDISIRSPCFEYRTVNAISERLRARDDRLLGVLRKPSDSPRSRYLAELDRRKLFFHYASLRACLVSEHGMEEWVAERRIRAARMLIRFPFLQGKIDHVQEWALGGKTELANARYLCVQHHRRVSYLQFGESSLYFKPIK